MAPEKPAQARAKGAVVATNWRRVSVKGNSNRRI
jgi:hypothetical protein